MNHIVLLGDSILDNAAYVGADPSVIAQLRATLPPHCQATLCAQDGSVVANLTQQLVNAPADASLFVLSIGGNNAIRDGETLLQPVTTVLEAFLQIAQRIDQFEFEYQAMLDKVLARKVPTVLCTIFYPRMTEAIRQRVSVSALAHYNDCILRAAFQHGLPVLDLRLICNEAADYAYPIEPSTQGGQKIVAALLRLITTHDFAKRETVIYT